jgi:amino acid transporter
MSDEPHHARPLGFTPLLALGVNGIVGVGIFFAPASVAAEVPGSAGAFAYLLTALAMLPIAFGYAALGRRFSIDGGPYVWATAAFGPRFAFFVGWITFASSLLSLVAVLSGFAHQLAPLVGFGKDDATAVRVVSLATALLLAVVAGRGLHLSAVVWTAVTALKLLPLALLAALGLYAYGSVVEAAVRPVHTTAHDLERAALVIVFALQGFEIVPLLAGSVRQAERSVPWATVTSLSFAAGLYAVLHALCARALPELGSIHTPLVAAAAVYGGSAVSRFVATGALVSALGIAFGMLNTTPRYLSALAEPAAFGPWIGERDSRFVPQRALWFTAAAVAALLVVGPEKLTALFVLSSLAVLAQYTAALAALAVLAWRERCGFSRRHLWPVPLSLAGVALAARGAEWNELVTAIALIFAGEGLRRFAHRRR